MPIGEGVHASARGERLSILAASMQHDEQGHRVRGRQSRRHIKAVVAGLPAGCLRDRAAMGRSECTLYPAHPAQGPRASGQPITGTAGPTMEKIAHQANVARDGCAAVSQHAKTERAVDASLTRKAHSRASELSNYSRTVHRAESGGSGGFAAARLAHHPCRIYSQSQGRCTTTRGHFLLRSR